MTTRSWTLAVAAALTLIAMPARSSAQAGRDQVEEGNRLYEEGRFQEAHQKYLEALRESPESPLIRFNAGNALYQGQAFEQAMEAYQQAIESGDPQLMSAAWYNLGNTLYRGQQLEPSLEAYKQALRLDPNDTDAKHNLERVLDQMEQQDQEDEQQDDEGEEQDEQNQDDQQEGQQDPDQQDPNEQEQDEDEEEQPEDPDQPQPEGEQEQEQEPQPQPGEMTPEEAERLLDAIREDPDDVNRKPAAARGRKPKKIW